jgi:hypothetical protein
MSADVQEMAAIPESGSVRSAESGFGRRWRWLRGAGGAARQPPIVQAAPA